MATASWRTIPAAVALVLVVAACGGDGAEEGAATVIFWHAMGGPLGEMLEDTLIAEFNASHPGIEVVPVSMGNYRALSQKIMASVMAGNPPVVAQAYETWTAQLIDGGVLVSFDSLMTADPSFTGEQWEDFFEVFRRNNSFDGTVYSFPFNKSVPAIYYNTALFDSLGLAPARTWEEQRRLLRSLTIDGNGDGDLHDESDVWGTAFSVSTWMFENLLVQAGGDLMAPDSQSTAFAGPRGVEALEFLSSLIHEDSVAYLSTGYEHQKEFAEGRVGLVQGSVTSLAFMESDMARREENGLSTFRIGIAPLPVGRRPGVIISGTNVVIFRDHPSARIDAAWEFVKWFTAPAQQARWFAATGYLPARTSSLEEPAARARIEEYPGLSGVLGQLDYATYEPQIKAWFDGREFLSEAVEIALYGQMTPEEALGRAAELADEEISTTD